MLIYDIGSGIHHPIALDRRGKLGYNGGIQVNKGENYGPDPPERAEVVYGLGIKPW